MTTETFDLHAVLTGRKYPTGTVHVWFEEEPWFRLAELEEKHAALKTEGPELDALEEQMAHVQKQIDESAYLVHIRGISPRAGEDIISKALAEYPIKRDPYGREDEAQVIRRNRYISVLSFAQHIASLVDPAGAEVQFTDDNRLDMARMILGEAPKTAIDMIDKGIAKVSRDFADMQARFSSPDFS